MSLAVSALYLLLAIVIIFGVTWVICWLLRTFLPQVPAQVQNFIYIVAAIICIIKVVIWLGGISGDLGHAFGAEARGGHVGAPASHERVAPRVEEHRDIGRDREPRRYEPAFVAPDRRDCDHWPLQVLRCRLR